MRKRGVWCVFVVGILGLGVTIIGHIVRVHERLHQSTVYTACGDRSYRPAASAQQHARTILSTLVVCDDGECCNGDYINRSCVWERLFYFGGHFRAITDEPGKFAAERHKVASGIRPHQVHHPFFFPVASNKSIVPTDTLISKPGTFLLLSGGPHFNSAHAILDEMYSIWLATLKLEVHSENLTCVLLNTGLPPDPVMLPVFLTVLGDCLFERDWNVSAAFVFERIVVGTGQMGLSTPGSDYVMPGRRFDALKRLSVRFYTRYQIPQPVACNTSLENRDSSKRMVVLAVPNRRSSNGVLESSWGQMVEASGFEFEYLDWKLPWTSRLELLRRTDVAVTGVGTGACNLFLLPDGAVIVSLGTTERSGSLSFQEEYLFAAMYWVRVVYPTYEQFQMMGPSVALDLVHAGVRSIMDNFDTSKAAAGTQNLSPIGQAAAQFFTQNRYAWSVFVARHLDRPLECMNMAERVLCEVGPWRGPECGETNRTELKHLRQQYGLCCACP